MRSSRNQTSVFLYSSRDVFTVDVARVVECTLEYRVTLKGRGWWPVGMNKKSREFLADFPWKRESLSQSGQVEVALSAKTVATERKEG